MNPAEYGRALYLLAKEEGVSKEILEQSQEVSTLLAQNPKYITLLDTPAVTSGEKLQLLDEAFGGLHVHLLSFLKILASKRAIYLFSKSYTAYKDAYEEDNNILHAYAVTAVSLDEKQSETLTSKLCRITKKNVVLHNSVDPSLVGGIRLQFNGKQLDASIEAQLATLRKSLKQSTL